MTRDWRQAHLGVMRLWGFPLSDILQERERLAQLPDPPPVRPLDRPGLHQRAARRARQKRWQVYR